MAKMKKKKKTNSELFLELAKPDSQTGVSRWVFRSEFVRKYASLALGNGCSWTRGLIDSKYEIEKDRSKTPGNRIDAIRRVGYKIDGAFSQAIRSDIKEIIRRQKCVMLGVCGTSENTSIEVDHKDGRKTDMRVSDMDTQRLEDFQPLCKAANDIKRQACKECKACGIRWDAKNIEGNPVSYYKGGAEYTSELGCVGCYLYDPVEYRRVTYNNAQLND